MQNRFHLTSAGDDRLRVIYDTAAKLFHRQGYAKTSMSDVAKALGLTKAGLYHHIESKERLLFGIINCGLDLLDAQVVKPVAAIPDPVEKLRCLLREHMRLILQNRYREITVILHENRTLHGSYRAHVDARKKRYIHVIRDLLIDLRKAYPDAAIEPCVGTFAILGMLNWLYQWYRPHGAIPKEELAEQFTELFLHGFTGHGKPHVAASAQLNLLERQRK